MSRTGVKKKYGAMSSWQFWLVVWGMGIAGQLCWNIENQWFNTFVYAKIGGDVNVVTIMVIVSAIVTTLSTFIFGTLSDRLGKRKRFISLGYIIWGITTIIFGLTEYMKAWALPAAFMGFLVVLTDAVMSFFGSMGYDSGYNVWLNDHTNDKNKGQVGAALAALPVFGTVVGTVVGGLLVNVGNPTASDPTVKYNPALDNYQLLFWAMGIFVIAMGVLSFFLVKDKPNLEKSKDGSFFHQLTSIFRFSKLKGNKNNKEMFLACLVVCAFFIPFNFYFVHLGNWLIYDIGFSAGDMGLIEGIALLFAVIITIPVSKLINKDKIPLVTCLSIAINAIGLFLMYFLIKDSSSVDTANLISAKNLPLILCVFLIGLGYVLIMQATMIWVRGLFPEESKGQFEGIRTIFFVLLPMLIGTLIGNIIIKQTPQPVELYDDYGHIIDVPQENLFLFAGILVLLAFIPLIFAWKAYNKRIKQKRLDERLLEESQYVQTKVEGKEDLVDSKGQLLRKGYSTKMDFIYNRDKVKKNRFNLKEWNFYQVEKGDYVLQLTIGHVSYMCSVTATLLNIATGDRKVLNQLKLFEIPSLDLDPEEDSLVEYKAKDFTMTFKVEGDKRNLTVKGSNKDFKDVDISIALENDKDNDKMVIATPFSKKKQFYLNYKENYYKVEGHVKFDDLEVDMTDANALLDWGRGIWPYRHEWYWGNLSSTLQGNTEFGFNIGWGFGNLHDATENMYFINRKAYKVGALTVTRDEKDLTSTWHLEDKEGLLSLDFVPTFDNYTQNKFVVVDTHCHQLYGKFTGRVKQGESYLEFKDLPAFIEHAENRW